jgi:hypothetical protein
MTVNNTGQMAKRDNFFRIMDNEILAIAINALIDKCVFVLKEKDKDNGKEFISGKAFL